MSFADRLRASGLSLWELGDLLGIHPHYLNGRQPDLRDHSVAVLIEICRLLDAPPRRSRARPGQCARQPAPDSADRYRTDADHDTQTVLNALTIAAVPLTPDVLADALDWPLGQVQQALNHALNRPDLAGLLALRRVPPDAYTFTTRLARQLGEDLPPIPHWAPWPGTLATNPDGTVADAQDR